MKYNYYLCIELKKMNMEKFFNVIVETFLFGEQVTTSYQYKNKTDAKKKMDDEANRIFPYINGYITSKTDTEFYAQNDNEYVLILIQEKQF